ncbi:MAG: hypothetical protein EYC70_00310 [Planctomycetota bacterium]|nr:MAG: hypothetical protein EYC70_00310 [Planctomycetota bacterium]
MSSCPRCAGLQAHDESCSCACHAAAAVRQYRRQRRRWARLYVLAFLGGAAAFWTWHLVHALALVISAATLFVAGGVRTVLAP